MEFLVQKLFMIENLKDSHFVTGHSIILKKTSFLCKLVRLAKFGYDM